MYVYWVHLPNSNILTDGYVGITKDIKKRWAMHKNSDKCKKFKNAINKYESDLIWEVVYEGTAEACNQLEEYYRPTPDIGWNIRAGGGNQGFLSEITKNKISISRAGVRPNREYNFSDEMREKRRITLQDNGNIKKVNIYDKVTHKVLASSVYLSIWAKEKGILNPAHLYKTLYGQRKSAYGFYARYA